MRLTATANLRTVLRFQRAWLKHNLSFKGWNSHVNGEFPGNLESRTLSRDNLSREIGRMGDQRCISPTKARGMPGRRDALHARHREGHLREAPRHGLPEVRQRAGHERPPDMIQYIIMWHNTISCTMIYHYYHWSWYTTNNATNNNDDDNNVAIHVQATPGGRWPTRSLWGLCTTSAWSTWWATRCSLRIRVISNSNSTCNNNST